MQKGSWEMKKIEPDQRLIKHLASTLPLRLARLVPDDLSAVYVNRSVPRELYGEWDIDQELDPELNLEELLQYVSEVPQATQLYVDDQNEFFGDSKRMDETGDVYRVADLGSYEAFDAIMHCQSWRSCGAICDESQHELYLFCGVFDITAWILIPLRRECAS